MEVDELAKRVELLEGKATLKSRVERLENKAGRRCHVVMTYEGETRDEALARTGVKPDANDSVVWIQHFCPEEVAGAGEQNQARRKLVE